jgi:predicted transcriptional regulator
MTSLLTLRVELRTRQRIARMASRRRISASEAIRQAIEARVERQDPVTAPYDAMSDLIGLSTVGNPAGRRKQVVA